MGVIEFPNTPDWLKKYYERNFRLIFYPTKQKGPSGQEALGWTERSDQAKDYREGQNVGVFLGTELSSGKHLADIDFDWSDGLPLAKRIFPATEFGFGRASRTISHAFYTTPTPVASLSFDNIDGKPFVELRGTKTDGTIGLQTMVPESIHPTGEQLVLKSDGEIGHSENLIRQTSLYATACMLLFQFPNHQLLHDTRLAVAGFLLTEGLTVEEALSIVEGVAECAGNNVGDARLTVLTTASRMKSGEHVYGKNALMKALGDQGKQIISRIKEWIGGGDFVENAKGQILINSQENVKRALDKINVSLSYDIFAQKPMVEHNYDGNGTGYKGPLVDSLVTATWLEIDEKYHFRPSKDFYYDVMQNTANKNKVHPVVDYLHSIAWDGQPRIDRWLIDSAGAADTEYVKAVSAIMMIAAVRRVIKPGCKYDEMLVLESPQQGLMKSTALRTLCPNEEWFSDDLPLNVDAKQIVERTLGKWIIEASDLSGMRASATEHLKGMLSRQVDGPVRLAYGRLPTEQRRQFIIVGTTNSSSYLNDTTGNRRFWPVLVKQFNIQWVRENRDQLWAEAALREENGESIRLDPRLYAHAALQQERRRAEDPWETKLDEVFPVNKVHRLSPDAVWGALNIPIERRDPTANRRLLDAMHRLKFRRVSVRTEEGTIVKGFGRDIDHEQMEFNRESKKDHD